MEFLMISTTSSSFKILKRVALVWQSARRPAAVYWLAPLEGPLRAWEGGDGGCNEYYNYCDYIIIIMIVRARLEPGRGEMEVVTTKVLMVNDDYHDACNDHRRKRWRLQRQKN